MDGGSPSKKASRRALPPPDEAGSCDAACMTLLFVTVPEAIVWFLCCGICRSRGWCGFKADDDDDEGDSEGAAGAARRAFCCG